MSEDSIFVKRAAYGPPFQSFCVARKSGSRQMFKIKFGTSLTLTIFEKRKLGSLRQWRRYTKIHRPGFCPASVIV